MDSESEEPDFDVDPAHAARAALLVARFAAAIQATKELQALRNRPRLLALEKLVFKCLDTGDAAFLNQKRLFRMMPPPLREKIHRECSCKWRHLPLVGMMANPHTRHLSLHLDECSCLGEGEDGWRTPKELDLFCSTVARECKTSLQSLEIKSRRASRGPYTGLHLSQVGSLLLELRALTSLHLECDFESRDMDLLVSILASTNPDIRSLRLPNLSNKSLCTIADRWPQLEFLQPDHHKFDSSQLEAVLPRLRNLQNLDIFIGALSKVMMSVARAHDPASPPYKLTEGFSCCYITPPASSGDMVKVFTAFPALYWLALEERDIPAVCAGLEGRAHIHITRLEVDSTSTNPRALEPLLALVGQHLIELDVTDYPEVRENRLDLNMIGHYCPKLQDLRGNAGHLVSSDEFEVTQTHFAKLKRCTLLQDLDENGPADLPTALVCRALASPTLESFESRGVRITEEVVAALAAERGRGALSSLETLCVWHPTVNVEALAALVSHAPRLETLTLKTYDDENEGHVEMHGVITTFVRQSRLKARVCSIRRWPMR